MSKSRPKKVPGLRNYWNVISASQLNAWDRSPRYWYFKNILKLPEGPRPPHFKFGVCLAECLERYLNATPQGEDPNTGLPVDVFPDQYTPMSFGKPHLDREGNPLIVPWNYDLPETDKHGRNREQQGAWIKELVQEAVEKSLLRRDAQRWVEKGVPNIMLVEDVKLTGDIDLAYPEELLVLDHKSRGKLQYATSKPKLKLDIQLNLYAAFVVAEMRNRGMEITDDTVITVGHINYSKNIDDPYGKRVKLKVTEITVGDNAKRMGEIVKMAEAMFDTSKVEPENFKKVECTGTKCANAYGLNSCPFMCICGGEETIEDYLERLDMMSGLGILPTSTRLSSETPTPKPEPKEIDMPEETIVQRMMRLRQQGDTESPKPPPPAETETVAEPEPQTVVIDTPSQPESPAPAVTSKRVSLADMVGSTTAEENEAQDTGPDDVVDGDDEFTGERKADGSPAETVETTPAPAAAAPAKRVSLADMAAKATGTTPPPAQTVESAAGAASEAAQEPVVAETTTEVAEPETSQEAAQEPEKPKRGRGRPTGSKSKATPKVEQEDRFLLAGGVSVARTSRKTVIDITDLLHTVGTSIAESNGVKGGYWKMNVWDRRDAIKAMAAVIVENYIPRGSMVFASSLADLDINNLFEALIPFASTTLRPSS